MEMLQRNKEDQRYGWIMRRKFKWNILQVKWEHRLNAQLKEELIIVNKYEEEVLVSEPEHGPLFFERNEDTQEESTKDILNHMKDSEQQEDLMVEASTETARCYVFKTDNFFIIAGIAGDKQPFEDVFRMDEYLEVKYYE